MEDDGVVGTEVVADAAAGAQVFVDVGPHRLHHHPLLVDEPGHPRGRGCSLRHRVGDILRALRTASDEDALGHRRHRVQFGMPLHEEAVEVAAHLEELRHLPRIFPGLDARAEDDHIHRDAALLADEGVLHLDDELALLARLPGRVGDLGHPPADEMGALVQHPMVELLVALARRPDVDVEVVHLGTGQTLPHQMREFQRIHTADFGAVLVVILVAGADAMDDGHALGLGDAIPQDDAPARGPGRIDQALEFQAGEDIGQPPVAILGDAAGVEQVVARGDDDIPHLEGDDLILLLEVDGLGGTEDLAGLALAPLEVGAVLGVDDRIFGHGLGEGAVDDLAIAHARLEFGVDDLARAFFDADAAAGAQVLVHVAGLLAHGDGEIADVTLHALHLAVCQQGDVLVLAHIHHLGREDAGGAVQGGEGLVQLGHMPANGGAALHQINVIARVGQLQRRGDAGDAAPHHQRIGIDVHRDGFQGCVVLHPVDRALDQGLGLVGRRGLVVGGPGVVLPDVGHLEEIRVQSRVLAGSAEGLLVHQGGTGRHHDAVQVLFLDIVLDQVLAQAGAHKLVIPGHDHAFLLARPARDLLHIHRACDIRAAVADVNADADVI